MSQHPFDDDAKRPRPPTLIEEFLQFFLEYKAWWLIPILVSLGLIGILVALSSTGAAPFIYTVF